MMRADALRLHARFVGTDFPVTWEVLNRGVSRSE